MRGDVMRWIGWLVAAVFGLGVIALIGAVVMLVRAAEGVPPLPVFVGLMGLVVLILLAGACLALISIAVSLRQGIAMPVAAKAPAQPAAPRAKVARDEPVEDEAEPETPARPVRTGRVLVATR